MPEPLFRVAWSYPDRDHKRGDFLKESEFFAVIAGIIGKSASTIGPASYLDEIGWDSLCLLSLIAEVDATVGSSIDVSAVHKATTLGDLYACVRADDA